MEHLHIDAVLFFMLVVKALPILSLDLHHSNNKSYKLLRLIRSATAIGSLNQTRAPSITNCYNSTCVLNEEYCNESKKGCERCLYEDGECTANWDCFNVCSEKKAQEICKGLEGSPWWSYIILGIFIISVVFNIYFVIEKLLKCRRHEMENRQKSDDKELEASVMLLKRADDSIQMSPQPQKTTPSKEPSAPPKTESPRISRTEILRSPVSQPTPDT